MTSVTLISRQPHPWSGEWFAPKAEDGATREHWCYFCQPARYEPMPDGQTICSCCGDLIGIPETDPMNLGMWVCPRCWVELRAEVKQLTEDE